MSTSILEATKNTSSDDVSQTDQTVTKAQLEHFGELLSVATDSPDAPADRCDHCCKSQTP